MENETRFDLNTTVENWRQELAAQPSLATDERRELETHLRDALAELKARGLSDEESFWLARRRVGQPQQLAEEFVKADPAKIWRERVFWMVVAYLAITLWTDNAQYFYFIIVYPLFGDFSWNGNPSSLENHFLGNEYFQLLFCWLPIFVWALILAKGWTRFIYPRIFVHFRTRIRLALIAIFGVLINCGILILFYRPRGLQDPLTQMHWSIWWSDFTYEIFNRTIWPLLLIALLVWLMPGQNRKISGKLKF